MGKGRDLEKKRKECFWRGLIPQCTLWMSSPSSAGLIHIVHGFFNLLFQETALLTWFWSLRMLLIRSEGHQGTMQKDWVTKPGQAPSGISTVILPILKVMPEPMYGLLLQQSIPFINNKTFNGGMRKWVDVNALYEYRIWFNLQSLSFCTLSWFWQIKYSSQLLKDMICDI